MRRTTLALVLCASVFPASGARGDDSFTERIAPILKQRCVQCHNAEKSRGDLDLTTRAKLLQGGAQGPAITPGKSAQSLLIEMISGDKPKMPRGGDPLTKEQIADLRRWIDEGASWPASVRLGETARKPLVGPDWWSLRPLARTAPPTVKDAAWVRTPIDAFILAKLDEKGITPSAPADARTLIRRLTFDLHGLPPTPDEIDEFVRAHGATPQAATERLVDRLLASPRYGERWGRHWLDVVHYGDTHGYDKDKRRDQAWPYRDYVIRAFNDDKPYARFIQEQLAGDVLFPDDPQAIIATGFVTAGPWDFVGHVELREGTVDKLKTRLIDRDDMVANTFSTFQSLTVHCARCHDHKFDPIPQKDYYRLQAVFAGVDRGNRPYARPTKSVPAGDMVYAVVSRPPRPIHVLPRGNVETPGEEVTAGGLTCLPGLDPDFKVADAKNEGQRRAALAQWLANPRNVLTWRSVVNRVWHYHFGRGLVDSPNDFGWNGGRPTHPELLDWLALEFRDTGGSFKKLHRLILLSACYRQSSGENALAAKVDADNRLLGRMNRQRLDAESVRDAVLAVSGKLDFKAGGPGFELFRFKDDHSPIYDHSALEKIHDPATYRRTVYRFTVRSVPNPFLDCLDSADPNLNVPVRTTTLTALRALALLNDPFMIRQSEFLAERLKQRSPVPRKQVEAAYQLALGRLPDSAERTALADYASKHGLANACRLLFNLNEFVFID